MLLLISWRNLWRNRTRSLAIIASVAMGIWAGVFISAFYLGFGKQRVEVAIRQEISHIQVHRPAFKDEFDARYHFNADSMESVLRTTPDLKAFSLRSIAMGMLANASGSNGVQINGISPGQEDSTRGFKAFVKTGVYLDEGKKNQILIGKKLADKMKLETGAKVVLTFQNEEQVITAAAFRICGIYETLNAPLDERNVYVLRDDLNALLGTPGSAMEAAILLHSENRMTEAVNDLSQKLPGYKVEPWQTVSPETAYVTAAVDASTVVIIVIVMLALAFGIINTMLMAVLERVRELGMLLAIGMNRSRVFMMVVLETVMLTFTGCPPGFLLGWMTVAWLGKTGINMSAYADNAMKNYGYESIIYPEITSSKVIQILLIVCMTAILASIFPAWKTLRLRPADAIRQ
jgi:ABC-type lipoprotein release transport system permease subunit